MHMIVKDPSQDKEIQIIRDRTHPALAHSADGTHRERLLSLRLCQIPPIQQRLEDLVPNKTVITPFI